MDIDQLRCIVAVTDLGSFSRAATFLDEPSPPCPRRFPVWSVSWVSPFSLAMDKGAGRRRPANRSLSLLRGDPEDGRGGRHGPFVHDRHETDHDGRSRRVPVCRSAVGRRDAGGWDALFERAGAPVPQPVVEVTTPEAMLECVHA